MLLGEGGELATVSVSMNALTVLDSVAAEPLALLVYSILCFKFNLAGSFIQY